MKTNKTNKNTQQWQTTTIITKILHRVSLDHFLLMLKNLRLMIRQLLLRLSQHQLIWTQVTLWVNNSNNICNNNKCNSNSNSKHNSYNTNKWWLRCHHSSSKFIKPRWWQCSSNRINIRPHCCRSSNSNFYSSKSKKKSKEVILNLKLKTLVQQEPTSHKQLEVTCSRLSNISNNKPNIITKSPN